MRTSEQNRRYHLHKKLKGYAKVDIDSKTIYINEATFPTKKRHFANELVESFNYQIALTFV